MHCLGVVGKLMIYALAQLPKVFLPFREGTQNYMAPSRIHMAVLPMSFDTTSSDLFDLFDSSSTYITCGRHRVTTFLSEDASKCKQLKGEGLPYKMSSPPAKAAESLSTDDATGVAKWPLVARSTR